MWIVLVALRRPYTFLALALLIVLLGVFTLARTATDIFPSIRIPIVATIWTYTGLPPEDMANRIVLGNERNAPTVVNDIEHTESQSLNGIAVVKYFFQTSVNEDLAFAQITGVSAGQLRSMPPGSTIIAKSKNLLTDASLPGGTIPSTTSNLPAFPNAARQFRRRAADLSSSQS